MELLQKYFPEDKYNIVDLTNKPIYKIIQNKYILEVYEIKDKDNNNCITFTVFIKPDNNKQGIYIKYLEKCASSSGTNLLNILEQYAIERGDIIQIDLEDASNIEICDNDFEFSLFYLYLLTTGLSWYNKLGYISMDTISDKEHNMIEIQKNFARSLHELLNKIIVDIKTPKLTNVTSESLIYAKLVSVFNEYFNIKFNIKKQPIEEILEPTFLKICETLTNIITDVIPELLKDIDEGVPFSLIEKFTIQELFIILHNYIKKHKDECDDNDVRRNFAIILLVLLMFKRLFTIKYDSKILTKEIIKTGGKRKQSSKRSNRQNKKSKKKRKKTIKRKKIY